jgi:hypothetical protein
MSHSGSCLSTCLFSDSKPHILYRPESEMEFQGKPTNNSTILKSLPAWHVFSVRPIVIALLVSTLLSQVPVERDGRKIYLLETRGSTVAGVVFFQNLDVSCRFHRLQFLPGCRLVALSMYHLFVRLEGRLSNHEL